MVQLTRMDFSHRPDADARTGMPRLPDGQFWHIERGIVQVRDNRAGFTWLPKIEFAPATIGARKDVWGDSVAKVDSIFRQDFLGQILMHRDVSLRTVSGYEMAVLDILAEIESESLFGDYSSSEDGSFYDSIPVPPRGPSGVSRYRRDNA